MQKELYSLMITDPQILTLYKTKLKSVGIELPPAPISKKDSVLAVSWEFDLREEKTLIEYSEHETILGIPQYCEVLTKIEITCWVISENSIKVKIAQIF